MLSCREVIARHSEYIDGIMPAPDSDRWRAHLATCAVCARYDRVLRKGVQLLHTQTSVDPDPEFIQHLRYRIAYEDARMHMRPIGMNTAAVVTIAAIVAFAAWVPFVMMKMDAAGTTAAGISGVDATVAEIAWHGDAAVEEEPTHATMPAPAAQLRQTNPAVGLIDQGYTPLIIEEPTAPPSYVTFTSLSTR